MSQWEILNVEKLYFSFSSDLCLQLTSLIILCGICLPDSLFLCQMCSLFWRMVSVLRLFPEKTEKLQRIPYIKILHIRASIVTRISMTTSRDTPPMVGLGKFPYRATTGEGHCFLPWYFSFHPSLSFVIRPRFHVASWSCKVLDIKIGKVTRKGLIHETMRKSSYMLG